jgi:hypothetical protein
MSRNIATMLTFRKVRHLFQNWPIPNGQLAHTKWLDVLAAEGRDDAY